MTTVGPGELPDAGVGSVRGRPVKTVAEHLEEVGQLGDELLLVGGLCRVGVEEPVGDELDSMDFDDDRARG